ncbi:MAG: TetR/AcrR family transcriptional regulator [Hyphomonadaceae bacterium]|nr:TetR/AcrR family transcriptional regulator [Hyphomonadaceae bacterium]
MAKTETRRGEARDDIVRSVLDLIAESGIESVTHRSAAAKTGVSPGTVTYHFASRDSLIDAALTQYVSEYQAGLAEAVANQPITSREALVRFLVGTTALTPDTLTLSIIEAEMALLAQRTGRLAGVLQAWQRSMEPILSEVLEDIGVLRPVEAARSLVAVCRGTEFEVMARGAEIDPETLKARLEAVLKGLMSS